MKEPIKEQLLDDLYFFCKKSKFKEYFHNEDITTDEIQQKERCERHTKLPKEAVAQRCSVHLCHRGADKSGKTVVMDT